MTLATPDDEHGVIEPVVELLVLARELRDVQGLGPVGIDLRATPLRYQCGHLKRLALAPPGARNLKYAK